MIVYNSQKVPVKQPKNLTANDSSLFEKLSFYNSAQLKVECHTDVILVPSGIAIKNSNIIKASIAQNKEFYQKFQQSVKDQLQNGELKTLDRNKQYLLVHNQWCGGYYHWVTEALSRLWVCKNMLSDTVFLLPLYPAKIRNTHLESLKAFEIKESQAVVAGINLEIPNLIIPSNYRKNGIFVPEIIVHLRDLYHKYILKNNCRLPDLGDKIYISRKNASRRKITNEVEIIEVLDKYGFEIICTEEYSFFEVIAIMYNSRYLVSIYGAGLTNMMFMKSGGRVLELQKRLTIKNERFDASFYNLASVCQLEYYYQFCEPINLEEPKITADIEVDKGDFQQSMISLMSQ